MRAFAIKSKNKSGYIVMEADLTDEEVKELNIDLLPEEEANEIFREMEIGAIFGSEIEEEKDKDGKKKLKPMVRSKYAMTDKEKKNMDSIKKKNKK